jgi:glycosyltransferase involved in cell wall biosynthesis
LSLGLFERLALATRLVRAEGAGSVARRLADHAGEWQRRRTFRMVAEGALGGRAAVLNVLPSLPAPRLGGVQIGMLRRLEAEVRQRPIALLYPFGEGYRLEVEASGRRAAVLLDGPPPAATPALRDPAFEAAVLRAAKAVGASVVHVENIAGLAPGSLAALPEAGLATILSIQDFAGYCPRPQLLEEPVRRFCDYSTDAVRCERCLACSWTLDASFLPEYRRLAAVALSAASAVIYLSPFVRERYAALIPGLDPARQHVIAPSSGAVPMGAPVPRASAQLHAAFVGAVRPHKGALVFEEVVALARRQGLQDIRWSAYGGGDPEVLRRLRRLGVTVHGYYRAGSLPALLRRDGVNVALLLSIWPETYTLVVDECLAAHVPVVAFDLGAPAERVQGGNGRLVPLAEGAVGVLRAVEAAHKAGPVPEVAPRTASQAADAVLDLYSRAERASDTMHH